MVLRPVNGYHNIKSKMNMGSRRAKNKRKHGRAVQTPRERKLVPIVAALLGAGLLAVGILYILRKDEQSDAKTSVPSNRVTTTGAPATEAPSPAIMPTDESAPAAPSKGVATASEAANASEAKPRFGVLAGKWLRPDGGYVVEITNVTDSGTMDVSYSNPQRIKVSKAQASQDGAATKVFIELRDTNYPGCTYDLIYDPKSDRLEGIYYQAALQQRFEVVFVRMK
jgi:uncharacterized protein (DUF2147 family)